MYRNLVVSQKVSPPKDVPFRKYTVSFPLMSYTVLLTFTRTLQTSQSTRKVAHDILRTSDGFE